MFVFPQKQQVAAASFEIEVMGAVSDVVEEPGSRARPWRDVLVPRGLHYGYSRGSAPFEVAFHPHFVNVGDGGPAGIGPGRIAVDPSGNSLHARVGVRRRSYQDQRGVGHDLGAVVR